MGVGASVQRVKTKEELFDEELWRAYTLSYWGISSKKYNRMMSKLITSP